MKTIQPGHEVLSLFSPAAQPQAFNKKLADYSWIISAFFIVLAVGLILGLSARILGSTSPSVAATSILEEKVAFQPGQFIRDKISPGYIGDY